MKVKVWGARGSVPTPGPATNRYGGNTSCLQVTLSDESLLVLDAGSGIRNLGLRLAGRGRRIDILLTHLHLDHILGLMFFAPLFLPDAEIVIWGPHDAETPSERLACYLSPPLTPLHLHELPARISFRACHYDPVHDDEQLDRLHAEAQAGCGQPRGCDVGKD
jgi:phosphoribosyl 1,2-cyclic phosphodiesterase